MKFRAAAFGLVMGATAARPFMSTLIRSRPYGDTHLATPEAFYDEGLGQFILPYDAVHQSGDPDKLLLGFLQETYVAAAELAKWDRAALEREPADVTSN